MVVGDEGQGVIVGGVVLGLEHSCPESVGVLGGYGWWSAEDGFHVVFDGGGVLMLVGRRRQGDSVGGFEGAAAVDEFGVDLGVFGGA
ncbi:hypothetical protein ACIQC5_11575 [Paenarthrobacter sp. NPDC092416]|uniref:hypothetical protein n=1 Tax=Paenarthrobacter sp. NPDC092416 TaxID=3364386 RepID=UPI003811325C